MIIQFWGVRGSVPSPGPATVRYGGNTACVTITLDSDRILVLDAGTGIRPLGHWLASTDHEIYLAVTHRHWDHIEGFPFFAPIYQPHRQIHLLPVSGADDEWSLLRLTDGVYSAVDRDALKARFSEQEEGQWQRLESSGVSVETIRTNHPGGATAFRVASRGRSVVYMTDNELDPPTIATTTHSALVNFCRDADVLVHDATYLDFEIASRRGWGHSTVRQACEFAVEANVGRLVLFHHEPDRSDDELDLIGADARLLLQSGRRGVDGIVAYEGLTLDL